MSDAFPLVAKTFFGLEQVLADELIALGAADVTSGRRMASFSGDRRLMYRANLWCRTAVRILKPIHSFPICAAADPARSLYEGVRQVDWQSHLAAGGTLAIDPVVHSRLFANSMFAAQLAKDAIVDQLRGQFGVRPSVDRNDPDLRINLHIAHEQVTIYLDSSGSSLHHRGYRRAAGEAPINEVLAAGILRLTAWQADQPLADFMCGSGTFPIEAALLARNIAPGLLRASFGYQRWPDYDRGLHDELCAAAREIQRPNLDFKLQASDLDAAMVLAARQNARAAGVESDIQFRTDNFESVLPLTERGVLVVNPPYDERLKAARIEAVYRRIGDALKRHWQGYTAFIFTGNLEAARHIGLRTSAKIRLFNGPIECRLLKFSLYASHATQLPAQDLPSHSLPDEDFAAEELLTDPAEPSSASAKTSHALSAESWRQQAQALHNRLARMSKHWSKWARRQGVECYRLYDRDIPEIPLSLDWYAGSLLITEHERPHGRTQIEHQAWLDHMARTAADALKLDRQQVFLRGLREPDAGARSQPAPRLLEVTEAGLRFQVDLAAGDPGLPLDFRTLRSLIHKEAAGRRFLNLFGGAGAATIYAAAGGAAETITVEPSPGRLDWARSNLRLNAFDGVRHQLVRSAAVEFLAEHLRRGLPAFDLVFANPPASFTRNQDRVSWDVRPAFLELLRQILAATSTGGKIYFVTRNLRCKFSPEDFPSASLREITRQTVPPDFQGRKIHRAWTLIKL